MTVSAVETPPSQARPRILIVGCGAIGGSIAAALHYQGHDPIALTSNQHIRDAINRNGFQTTGESSLGAVAGQAISKLNKKTDPFDWILLCTRPPQVEEAAQATAELLKDSGNMVCFQNGLCESRVAAIVGSERVVGGIVSWGASMPEPGVYERTSAGGFVLGRSSGTVDPAMRELARFLECIGPVELSNNLLGARWSKLAINCAISSLGTVGGDRLGALLRKRFVRRMALEVFSETVAVAQREGVQLEKVAGTLDLEWLSLTDEERAASLGSPGLFAKHALLLAVGTRYRRLRSSMLRAIERGRAPAVDFLNGEVTRRGREHGIPTPMNQALQDAVWRIANGKLQPGQRALRDVFAQSRPTSQASSMPASPPAAHQDSAPEAPAANLDAATAVATPSTLATTAEATKVQSPLAAASPAPPNPSQQPPSPVIGNARANDVAPADAPPQPGSSAERATPPKANIPQDIRAENIDAGATEVDA